MTTPLDAAGLDAIEAGVGQYITLPATTLRLIASLRAAWRQREEWADHVIALSKEAGMLKDENDRYREALVCVVDSEDMTAAAFDERYGSGACAVSAARVALGGARRAGGNVSEQTIDVSRFDFLDFPTAWAIQHAVGPTLDHHPRCSSVPGWDPISGPAFLCDCGAIQTEWRRRRAEAGLSVPGDAPAPPAPEETT